MASGSEDESDPFRAITDNLENEQRNIQREVITLSITGQIQPKLLVDASPGCGGIAWPAGEVLSKYLALVRPEGVRGCSILELGAGTGLVGLVAGFLGAKEVWVSDQLPLIPIMEENIRLNGLSDIVHACELNWGAELVLPVDAPRQFDLILAADCVYFEPAFPLLVQTLTNLAILGLPSEPEILFCYKKRRKADKRFFNLLKKQFSWTEVEDDPGKEAYSREAISILKLIKRR